MSNKTEAVSQALEKSLSFSEYLELITALHQDKKATSFQEDEAFFNYSKLGLSRMKRVYKKVELSPSTIHKVKAIKSKQTWMLITESWCGDASQTVPIIVRLAELNEHIDLRIILRDSNPDVMAHYLTNGGMSIPILAMLDSDHNEIGRWGPRPTAAQQMLMDYKAMPEETQPPYAEFSLSLQKWYNQDKGVSTMSELSASVC